MVNAGRRRVKPPSRFASAEADTPTLSNRSGARVEIRPDAIVPQRRLRSYYSLAVASLGFAVLGVSLLSYPTISSIVSQQFTLTNTESGLLTSAFSLTYTIMQIPAGLISDRIGGPKTLLVSLSILTVAPFIFILGDSFDGALVSRAVAGIGAGMVLPSAVRLLASTFPEKELHRAMGVLGTGWGGSQALTYLVLPLLILGQDWRPPLEFTIAICFATAVMSILPARWASITPKTPSPHLVKVKARRLLTKRFFVLVLSNFTCLVVTVGILSWAPALLTANLGVSEVEAGRLISVSGIAGVVSSFAGGVLSQRVGPRPVILVSMLLLVFSPYFLAMSSSWSSALVWIAMIGIGGNMFFGPVMALVPYSSDDGVRAAGFSFGIFNTLSNVGNFLSPLIIGIALDQTHSFLVGFTALGLIGISGVVGAIMTKAPPSARSGVESVERTEPLDQVPNS